MDENQQIMRIMNSLRELNQSFYQATRKEVEAFGITQIQMLVLRMLKQNPLIGLNELSDRMHTSASTTSGLADRLVQAGLIARERPAKDRRAIVLKLTEEGERLLERISECFMNRLSPLWRLSAEDYSHLLRIHGQIVNILQQAREDK